MSASFICGGAGVSHSVCLFVCLFPLIPSALLCAALHLCQQLAMTSGPVGPNAGKRRPNVRHGLNGGGEESLKAPASRRRTSSVSSSKSSRRQSSSDGTDSCPSSLT